MSFTKAFISIFFLLLSASLFAAQPDRELVCHVGNELGSSGETYQDNPDCTIPPEWGGEPADYICPDAGKVDLIMVSKKAKHIGNPSHSFEDDTGYLWEDYSPEEGIGDDPADFEEGDVPGIDRGCELELPVGCPCADQGGTVTAAWNGALMKIAQYREGVIGNGCAGFDRTVYHYDPNDNFQVVTSVVIINDRYVCAAQLEGAVVERVIVGAGDPLILDYHNACTTQINEAAGVPAGGDDCLP